MKHSINFAAVAFFVCGLSAAPVVQSVTMSQAEDRTVTIEYSLSEAGIVTVDIQTNNTEGAYVSIGGQHLTHFTGDVNRLVSAGTHKMTWKPRKAWPNDEVKDDVKAVVTAWAKDAPPDYMVCSLSVTNTVRFYTCAESIPYGVTNDMYKTEYLVMRKIPAANVEWRMGSPSTEYCRDASGNYSEIPHIVALTNDYYIGVYPVTQRQYELMMKTNPSYFNNVADYATRPVERVKYDDIRGSSKQDTGFNWPQDGHAVLSTSFMGVLRTHTGMNGFDLPTEAQWEFACRAGCGSALYNGMELSNGTTCSRLAELGRYQKNGGYVDGTTVPDATCTADNGTAKVGSYAPNAFGLYDMLGNVWEWCLDNFVSDISNVDPETGSTTFADLRSYRGGAWTEVSSMCRAAARRRNRSYAVANSFGFRVACSAVVE